MGGHVSPEVFQADPLRIGWLVMGDGTLIATVAAGGLVRPAANALVRKIGVRVVHSGIEPRSDRCQCLVSPTIFRDQTVGAGRFEQIMLDGVTL
jgi:hypothetical protein